MMHVAARSMAARSSNCCGIEGGSSFRRGGRVGGVNGRHPGPLGMSLSSYAPGECGGNHVVEDSAHTGTRQTCQPPTGRLVMEDLPNTDIRNHTDATDDIERCEAENKPPAL